MAALRAVSLLGRWIPVLLYGGFISYLSAQPSLQVPAHVPDKIAHGGEFAIFAALLWRAVSGRVFVSPGPRALLAIVAACAAYAAVDEIHQAFVPGRDSSAADALADTLGASASLGVLWGLSRRRITARAPLPAVRHDVTLLSKTDCRLCEEAEIVLKRVQAEIPFTYSKIDIASDEALSKRYASEVPVVLLDGRKVFKFRIDEESLRRRLLGSAGEAA